MNEKRQCPNYPSFFLNVEGKAKTNELLCPDNIDNVCHFSLAY